MLYSGGTCFEITDSNEEKKLQWRFSKVNYCKACWSHGLASSSKAAGPVGSGLYSSPEPSAILEVSIILSRINKFLLGTKKDMILLSKSVLLYCITDIILYLYLYMYLYCYTLWFSLWEAIIIQWAEQKSRGMQLYHKFPIMFFTFCNEGPSWYEIGWNCFRYCVIYNKFYFSFPLRKLIVTLCSLWMIKGVIISVLLGHAPAVFCSHTLAWFLCSPTMVWDCTSAI